MELKKDYTNEQTGIRYSLHGDFYLPDIKVSEENIVLGKWGMLYKDYLSNNKKVVFSVLLAEGKLYQHCAEIEKQANEMYDLLIEQMKKAEGVTEELKEQDQFEWVQRIGNIQQRAREIVCSELIYS